MHWISLIGFFLIINVCRAQSNTFRNSESANFNKGGTFQVIPSSNNPDASATKNPVDGSVSGSNSNTPSGSPIKHEKDARDVVQKPPSSNGNNNHCYIILPFVIAAFMTMVHF